MSALTVPDSWQSAQDALEWRHRLGRVCGEAWLHCSAVERRRPWDAGDGYTLTVWLPLRAVTWRDLAGRAEALAADLDLPAGCRVRVEPGPTQRTAHIHIPTTAASAEEPAPEVVSAEVTAERLALAVALTGAADAKASGLLTATGVLAAAATLASGPVSGWWPRAAVAVAAAALVTALLGVLAPRGGRPGTWLPVSDPAAELARVAGIADAKHTLLRVAVLALVVAVLAGACAACWQAIIALSI